MVHGWQVQTYQKPPQLNNDVDMVLQKAPSRQTALLTKQDFIANEYSNTKYADLFMSPAALSNMYSFDHTVPAYPLDTVIPSYPLPSPQKGLKELGTSEAHASQADSLSKADFELLSLLTFSPATNTDPRQDQDRAADFAIPSSSGEIFDLFPSDIFLSPEGDASQSAQQTAQPASQLLNNLGPEQLPQDTTNFWIPPSPQSSSPLQPPSTLLIEALSGLDESLAPLSSSSSSSLSPPDAPSLLPESMDAQEGLSIEDQIRFLGTSLELDGLLSQASKNLQEPPSPVSSAMHTSPPVTPLPSPFTPAPITPSNSEVDIKPVLPSPSPSPVPSQNQTKPSPLLFGHHEDDILHKLLGGGARRRRGISRNTLVSMPVEEFNRLLESADLSEIEVAFMKEWRRRGKNKTAAMVARKRKRDELSGLDEEVESLRKQKSELQAHYNRLRSDISSLKDRTRSAEDRVFQRHTKQSGVEVSRETHVLHIEKGDKVMLVPRNHPQQLVLAQ